jgi:Arc/MetJ family transcription regulator
MSKVKTPIEIDQEALAVAAEVLGTKTKKTPLTRRSAK